MQLLKPKVLTTQATRGVEDPMNPTVSILAFMMRYFVRMSHPVFLCSKVGEDPKEFMDEVYEAVNVIGVSSVEKVKLAANKLRDVTEV